MDKRLELSYLDRMALGVCGGLGNYFDVDPKIIRIIFAIGTFISFGTGILVYLILYLIMKY